VIPIHDRKEQTKVTMATTLILNGVAVVGLLALLAATMRLPYHLPTSPRSGDAGQDSQRHQETSAAEPALAPGRGAPEPVYSR
jgi:hypothetical protein